MQGRDLESLKRFGHVVWEVERMQDEKKLTKKRIEGERYGER
jgi:hypothetical protein